jgi:hypothetical protein
MGGGSLHQGGPADVLAESRVRSVTVDGRMGRARLVRRGAERAGEPVPHLFLQHLCPRTRVGAAQPACRQPSSHGIRL